MKLETLLYEKIRDIIPEKSEKTIFFGAISQTSYEMFFYAFIDGKPVQCYELAEQGVMDENELAEVFESVVHIVKESKAFDEGKMNIVTVQVDKSGIELDVEHVDRDERMYRIKKGWEDKYI